MIEWQMKIYIPSLLQKKRLYKNEQKYVSHKYKPEIYIIFIFKNLSTIYIRQKIPPF